MSLAQGASLRSLWMSKGKGMGRGRPRMKRKAGNTYIQVKENPEPTLPPPALVLFPYPFSGFLFFSLPPLLALCHEITAGGSMGRNRESLWLITREPTLAEHTFTLCGVLCSRSLFDMTLEAPTRFGHTPPSYHFPISCFYILLDLCCLPPQPNHKLKQPEPQLSYS